MNIEGVWWIYYIDCNSSTTLIAAVLSLLSVIWDVIGFVTEEFVSWLSAISENKNKEDEEKY